MQGVGVFRRAVAVLIDGIILFIVYYAVALATGGTNAASFSMTGLAALTTYAVGFAYFIVMEATRGATIGKLVMGLKVVKQDGSAMDWGASIIRNLLRIIDGFCFYLVGAILVWATKSKQRLGDIAAHTLVVSAKG
jgi:uncharacterized RDD family membrane protein YckC